MASLSSPSPPYTTPVHRRPAMKSVFVRAQTGPDPKLHPSSSPPSPFSSADARKPSLGTMIVTDRHTRRMEIDVQKMKEKEARERKEEVNRKVASKKAISVILRREATKAIIEKKRGPTNSKKLLPRTVLEALHERMTALRWESALKVSPSVYDVQLS